MASKRLRQKRRQQLLLRASIIALGICVLLSIAAAGSWRKEVRVTTVEVQGHELVKPQDISRTARMSLVGRDMLIFPANSIATFSKKKIKHAVREAFPRIEDVHVSRSGWSSILVTVDEREAAVSWCGVMPGEMSTCVLADEQGYLFDYGKDTNLLTVYGPLAEEGSVIENMILREGAVTEMISLTRALVQADIPVAFVVLSTPDEVALHLGSGPYISYVLGEEAHVAEVLPTLLEELAPELHTIEYIDMRFGNRVYVKRYEFLEEPE